MVSVSRQKSRRAAIESLHHCMNPKHDQSYTQLFRKKEMIHDPSLQFQCLSGPQISKNHDDLNSAIDSCHPQPMQYESLSCSSEFRPPPSNFALEPQCKMTASLSIISPPPANAPMTSWNNQNYSSSCWPETQQLYTTDPVSTRQFGTESAWSWPRKQHGLSLIFWSLLSKLISREFRTI